MISPSKKSCVGFLIDRLTGYFSNAHRSCRFYTTGICIEQALDWRTDPSSAERSSSNRGDAMIANGY